MTIKSALVVDDEPDIAELVRITLSRMGIQAAVALNVTQAIAQLTQTEFSLCLTDMNMPDGTGIDLVNWVQQHRPTMPIAVITAYGSIDTAISALKAGAFDFVSKPVDLPRLRELVNSAIKLADEASDPEATELPCANDDPLLGNSPEVQRLRGQIMKLARSQAPIYISGESGSGKELVARMIHHHGPRVDAPFVPVNCGAIPGELMESEFFGHRKGSFTGAHDHKEGLFQAANGGTLFLDEVADLPIAMQVKLLRAIQEKAVRPVGAQQEVAVDVRILSATHKNLADLVDSGQFRQDLFYRINVIELKVPPLRERAQDIALLANHILQRIAAECGVDNARISADAMNCLLAYRFPGNVRELENIIERAFTLCEGDVIEQRDLQLGDATPPINDVRVAATATVTPSDNTATLTMPAQPQPNPDVNLEEYLETIERDVIEKALEATRWNKTAAAKQLGISFRALRYRLKKLGME